MKKCTPKEEGFVNDWIATNNKTEAYRRNYSWKNMKEETINRKAIEVSKRDRVVARYNQLMKVHQDKAIFTKDELLEGLKRAFLMASGVEAQESVVIDIISGSEVIEHSKKIKKVDLKAISSISQQIAKLEGWQVDVIKHTGEMTLNNNYKNMSKDELEERKKELLARKK